MSNIFKAAQTTLSQNLGGVAHRAAPAGAQFSLDDVPDQTGKVALITGGSEGIGYACTYTLLRKNIQRIYLLTTSEKVVSDSIQAIKEELGENVASKMVWKQCDLSDWKRVVSVADEVKLETDRLDILINNAARGIMTYQLTSLGIDRHMAVNHIGHAILISQLLPVLEKTAETNVVRISNQSSNAHEQTSKDTKFASVNELNQDLGPMGLYGRSKLAGILYARHLTRRLHSKYPNILINATHPGVVDTAMSTRDIMEPYPRAGHLMKDAMAPFKKDQFEGAVSTMYAATVTSKSGEYICPPAQAEMGSALAQDPELADQLMKLTKEIVREKIGIEIQDT